MNFYLIGIDYRHASLNLRESVYRKRALISAMLNRYLFAKTVILSTCNRFEIYGTSFDESSVPKDISFIRSLVPELAGAYVRFGFNDVFRHLTRLASGLQSQLKGELQILQQLQAWAYKRDLPYAIKKLLEEAILSAKKVRMKAGLFSGEHNLAGVVFCDLKKQISFSSKPKLIIAGTGKIAELFALYKPQGTQLYFAAHKNIIRAKELAKIANADVVGLSEVSGLLETVDALVSASASPHFIFLKESFVNIKLAKPLYLYDLAMPADIEPAAGEIEGVTLKNLEALAGVFKEFNARLAERLKLAEYLIEEEIEDKQEGAYGQNYKDRYAAEFACPQAG